MKLITGIFGWLLAGVLAVCMAAAPVVAQISSVRDSTAAFIKETTLLASASRGAGAVSSSIIDAAAYNAGNIWIDATAVGGSTQTLDVTFDSCSSTTTASCISHTASTQLTGVGATLVKVTNFGRYVRVTATVGGTGTPTVTFSVKAAFKPTT